MGLERILYALYRASAALRSFLSTCELLSSDVGLESLTQIFFSKFEIFKLTDFSICKVSRFSISVICNCISTSIASRFMLRAVSEALEATGSDMSFAGGCTGPSLVDFLELPAFSVACLSMQSLANGECSDGSSSQSTTPSTALSCHSWQMMHQEHLQSPTNVVVRPFWSAHASPGTH